MTRFAKRGNFGLLLEAEVPPKAQARFANRYQAASGVSVSPGNPKHYQNQPNKRAAELRIYFNDPVWLSRLRLLAFTLSTRAVDTIWRVSVSLQ